MQLPIRPRPNSLLPSASTAGSGAARAFCRALRPALALALGLALLSGQLQAAPATERSKQKMAAETRRAALQLKLSILTRDIKLTESAKESAADTLFDSEQAISNANRSLHDLAGERAETGIRLTKIAREQSALSNTVSLQKNQLTRLLREQYMAGNEDRIKLLLSGDNPNRISRDLQMMDYVSQAQAKLLATLRSNLLAVENSQRAAQNARDELEEIAREQTQQKNLLEQENARHAKLLSSLSSRLTAQRMEAGNVKHDEQRMTGLVDKLGQLIKEQDAIASRERRRQEQLAQERSEAKARAEQDARLASAKALADYKINLARARAQANVEAEGKIKLARARALIDAENEVRARLVRAKALAESERVAQQSGGKPPARLDAIDSDAAPALASSETPAQARLGAAPELPPLVLNGTFASLRGHMRSPVTGRLGARFGSKRGDGPSWKGVFIRAAEGVDVKAVAPGRVVFADWLRGFGNLLIVDHGGQYMSIYGNNQALLKRAGDAVKAGDVIASAGNSGGNEESGLYFELRHQGRAFDPAGWVNF